MFKKATQEYSSGNTDTAIQLFKDCIDQDPNFAEAHLNLATINYHKGKFPLALNYARRAYNYNKFQPEIYEILGLCYFQDNSFDSSAVMLKRAVTEFGSKSEEVLVYLGRSLNEIGESEEAIEFLNQVIANNSSSAAGYNERGASFFYLEDYESAQADFEKALELANGESAIYTNLANLSFATEDHEKGLEYLEKAEATATEKEKANILILKGNYHRSLGDLDAAEASFEESFKLNPKNPAVLVNQASLFIDKENYQLAWEKCNAALEINNQFMEAYHNRGIANEMLRRTDDACLDWQQALILGSVEAEEFLNSAACSE